ncbi:MAG: Rne/Rng family ribonuclease [Paracoccaceae bacterium]|nr:Rne/Rng family ribonuclease [Paracoccaceae bacterium]
MAKKMLIDATHSEETRVVVVEGNKVDEFDFESSNKKQLAGNIYLAKVTRVEPSLQAAFVDYGGNRHGFLAFSEIHPDYYQIPVEDREKLIEEELAYAKKIQEEAEKKEQENLANTDSSNLKENQEDGTQSNEDDNETLSPTEKEQLTHEESEELNTFKPRHRRYKIQEVIKVRQILLIQVVKEERGNKGAALTTYLSIAGRYCVLMPNTARGGGISRKITNANDRKRLKSIANELEIPETTGLIVRTAGANRTKVEIKRDFEYLLRQWEEVRNLTLKSIAPCQIYEEGSLIKRSIRDLYTRDVDEIFVEGKQGFQSAKEFMKMLMPSHVKKVHEYNDPMPLFSRYQVESFLSGMFNPTVQLKSGGYLVIGITEALVAIDVNSGRATKEGSIEETALKTNLEAADELSRQLRLRDLAGLIVIDFIDMDERRNNNAVEKRLKDRLKDDRARIQIGRISNFGLLEMSRQRLRPGMLEATTAPCAHCHGTGIVRSDNNLALMILREVEEEAVRGRNKEILISTSFDVSNYLINNKREHILEIEKRNNISIRIEANPQMKSPNYSLEKFKETSRKIAPLEQNLVSVDSTLSEIKGDWMDDNQPEASSKDTLDDKDQKKKRRRRKRNSRNSQKVNDDNNNSLTDNTINEKTETIIDELGDKKIPEKKRAVPNKTPRTRTKALKTSSSAEEQILSTGSGEYSEDKVKIQTNTDNTDIDTIPKKRGRPKKTKAVDEKVAKSQNSDLEKAQQTSEEKPEKSKSKPIKKQPNPETKKKTPRSGWWSRNK